MIFHNRKTFFIFLSLIVCFVLFFSNSQTSPFQTHEFNNADTAWMIVASALVLLMTPGLAFFYGGMVSKNFYVVKEFETVDYGEIMLTENTFSRY